MYLHVSCPSAKTLLLCLCLAQLLVCAGDVETNPGPDKISDVVQMLKEVIASNEKYQKENSAQLSGINAGINDISRRVSNLETQLSEVVKLREEVSSVSEAVSQVKTDLDALARKQHETSNLTDVVDDLNNRLRRTNLVVKGLPEAPRESWIETEEIAKSFFSAHLGVAVKDIERAHRLGTRRANFHRPIIVKFLSYKSKNEVLSNAYKLKHVSSPKVWIEEDFSPRMQMIRKRLRDFARENREENQKYKLTYNKLFLNNVAYHYDPESDEVVPLPKQSVP